MSKIKIANLPPYNHYSSGVNVRDMLGILYSTEPKLMTGVYGDVFEIEDTLVTNVKDGEYVDGMAISMVGNTKALTKGIMIIRRLYMPHVGVLEHKKMRSKNLVEMSAFSVTRDNNIILARPRGDIHVFVN